ncbi:MAG: hypothetical protein M3245_03230, partial [Actinomycetota bacterium]|nr:hypothetical protein [Actinomycetota bacterium]
MAAGLTALMVLPGPASADQGRGPADTLASVDGALRRVAPGTVLAQAMRAEASMPSALAAVRAAARALGRKAIV